MPYQKAKLFDETVTLVVRNDGVFPASISNDGDGTYTGIDEKYPISAYHRVVDASQELLPGYGDVDNNTREITNMLMVIANDREHTKIKGVDLARYIKMGFRSSLTAAEINTQGVSQVLIETGATNLSKTSVIESEYTALSELPPNFDLLSISYQILMTIDKNCLSICEA